MRSAIIAAAALMSGCAASTATYPVEVTRFHVDTIGRGTIAVVTDEGVVDGPEFRLYAGAVSDALSREGYTVVPAGGTYVARVGVAADKQTFRTPPPFTIGLGGGGYSGDRGGGVGLGGSVGIPIGRGKLKERVATTLSVRINAREGNLGVWEGRAQTQDIRTPGTADATIAASKLATALFTGFPGESGRTITVK